MRNIASFVGCVGKDDFGKKLEQAIQEDGVKSAYLYDDETPTGTCACLIVKHERLLFIILFQQEKEEEEEE